jgi:hypothetical protein
MKKLLLTTGAVAALSFVCAPAFADVFTFWNFSKGKFTEINEVTQIEKTINVYVTDTTELDSSAQALVAVNDSITGDLVTFATVGQIGSPGVPNTGGFTTTGGFDGNTLTGTGTLFAGDQLNFGIHHASTITGSVQNDVGIGQLNQDSGNNSDQGNTISAAFVFDKAGTAPTEAATTPPTVVVNGDVAKAEAYVEQLNENNTAYDIEFSPYVPNTTTLHAPFITATITNSITGDVGVFMVNQNAGNMNSQQNALAAAVGDNTFTALSDAGLNQVNEGNFSFDINTVKSDDIDHSINNDTGIVAVNQSVGNMNNQATVISVSAIASFVGLP